MIALSISACSSSPETSEDVGASEAEQAEESPANSGGDEETPNSDSLNETQDETSDDPELMEPDENYDEEINQGSGPYVGGGHTQEEYDKALELAKQTAQEYIDKGAAAEMYWDTIEIFPEEYPDGYTFKYMGVDGKMHLTVTKNY